MGNLHAEPQRQASLVLSAINVYQPISRSALALRLGPRSGDQLDATLEFLVEHVLIRRLGDDLFRTTWDGQQALRSPTVSKSRDIQRMWHLAELEKEADS